MYPLLDYYTQPGPITQPGEYESLFEGLPTEINGLCRMVQGLMLHPFEAYRYGVKLRKARWKELELRSVRRMLVRIQELDDRPLTTARPAEKRLVGNCRDFSTMLCAMLRHQGVPARVRCGFARYFEPGFFTDHVVCEYWRADNGRWALADAQVDGVLRRAYQIALDTCDLPREQFLLAGLAWQGYRVGKADPERFGIASDGPRGLEFIRTGLLRDLAALNKIELLCQDEWDIGGAESEQGIAGEDLILLDRLAALTLGGDEALAEIRGMFENDLRPRMPRALSGRQVG